jgi:hypothetical protein
MQYDIYYDNSDLMARIMRKVYMKMFLGLLVSAATAFLILSVPNLLYFIASHTGVYFVAVLVELGLVLGINSSVRKMNTRRASAMFYLFAVVNAITLALIFLIYSPTSILKTFIITSATFGGMSIYGYVTKNDLSKFGSILMMAVWGLIVAIFVNMFWGNGTLDLIITLAGVAIFVGLTAWDTQKIKQWAQSGQVDESALATVGALTLYLDFINLFIYLLRLFGQQRD